MRIGLLRVPMGASMVRQYQAREFGLTDPNRINCSARINTLPPGLIVFRVKMNQSQAAK